MTALMNLKNALIDRILITKDKKLLESINDLLISEQSEEIMSLSSEQIEMLMMSEQDIEQDKIVSESELENWDSKWQV